MQSLDDNEGIVGGDTAKRSQVGGELEVRSGKAFANRSFAICAGIFQLLMIFLYGLFCDFPSSSSAKAPDIRYSFFMDVHVMIFIGFSFIVTFLKRYGYSAAGYNFVVAVIVIQWALLMNEFWSGLYSRKFQQIRITIEHMIAADYACATILISYGVVLGKTNVLQLFVIALIEVVAFTFNGMVCALGMSAVDMGAMYVHTFGTFFGLALSWVIGKGGEHKDNGTTKTTDLFSLLGTLFLWIYWPSANAALAEGPEQHKVVINTLLALCSSTVFVYITSILVRKDYKLKISDVQNASLAGGVAIGSVACLVVRPWLALFIGSLAGITSVLGYTHVQPWLWKTLHLHDTCGINNFHGIPGIIGGFSGAMASYAVGHLDDETIALIFPERAPNDPTQADDIGVNPGSGRTAVQQALMQLLALLVTIVFSAIAGLLTGLLVRSKAFDPPQALYNDAEYWDVPEGESGQEGETELVLPRAKRQSDL